MYDFKEGCHLLDVLSEVDSFVQELVCLRFPVMVGHSLCVCKEMREFTLALYFRVTLVLYLYI